MTAAERGLTFIGFELQTGAEPTVLGDSVKPSIYSRRTGGHKPATALHHALVNTQLDALSSNFKQRFDCLKLRRRTCI